MSAFWENTEAQLCGLPIILKTNNRDRVIYELTEISVAVTEKSHV